MCGIAGWFDFVNDASAMPRTLHAMVSSLRDRGPDGEGFWSSRRAAIGHRRLAVIDIEGGRQPMVLDRPHLGPLVLTFSGEIYNYRDLRRELRALGHEFRTGSDTEVVLNAWAQWAEETPRRLAGMYAFVIWDEHARRAFLVRDRMGVKPLYYYPYPGGLAFGSEPKAIMAHPRFRARVRESALPMLFNERLRPAGATVLDGLHEVRPATVVRLDESGLSERRYWTLESAEYRGDFASATADVRDLLTGIVSEHLVADVPLCTLLSGGLDSSAITALAATEMRTVTSFSVDFQDSGTTFRATTLRPERDAPYAREAARHIGTDHREVVLGPRDLIDALPAARAARDLPGLGQFDTSMYGLFAQVRTAATVALSGEAADEVFGGYPWFHDPRVVRRDTFPWLGDGMQLIDCLAPDVRRRVRPGDQIGDLYATLLAEVPRLDGEDAREARMREVLYLSMQAPLALLLDRKDRMSMAVGLEVRVPFCDHRLVEYLWNVPWALKTGDGREKSLLRAAMTGLLPRSVLERPKSAYPASFDSEYGSLVVDRAHAVLKDPSSPLAGVLDPERVAGLIAGNGSMTHVDAAHTLIPIVEVDAWMRGLNVGLT